MRTISISISESEFAKLGLQNDKLSYNDWLDLFARQNLLKAIELAEKYGLSTMNMDDITKEVRAVRDDAKDNS